MKLIARPSIIPSAFHHLQPDRFDKFQLYSSVNDEHWRYELRILDRKVDKTDRIPNPCAVFLIPSGRETEYLFSSRRGLLNIAESAKCARLIAVVFQRCDCLDVENPYQSQQRVQEELTATVQMVAQHGKFLGIHDENFQIPFMAVDGIGQRDVIARGETATTGTYIVEQVLVSDDIVRRLYFMRNPNVIQTEIYMKKGEPNQVNRLKLAFEYHKHIVAGYILLRNTKNLHEQSMPNDKALIIGLGGGGLHNFLQTFFKGKLQVTAVELDPGVVEIAKKHFGLEESKKSLKVIVGNGLDVGPASIVTTDEEKGISSRTAIYFPAATMGLIVIDVDSKDTSVGMSCPPISFVDVPYLLRLKELLVDFGILAINVSARDPEMLKEVQQNVSEVFSVKSVFMSGDLGDEEQESSSEALNVVIFAKNVLTSECADIGLPKGMEIIDRIFKVCEDNDIVDFELRGELEHCSSEVKRLKYVATKDTNSQQKSGFKKTAKRSAKGKKRK